MDVSRYSRSLVDVSGYPRSLIDASKYLILVNFGGIVRLVKSSKFLKCRVDINKNLRLMDLSGFPKFQFTVRAIYYRTFLFATGGGK